jgi:hypothetical protein
MTRNNNQKFLIPYIISYTIRKTNNFWFGIFSSRCLSLNVISLESAKSNLIKKKKKNKEPKRPLFSSFYTLFTCNQIPQRIVNFTNKLF